MDVGETPVGDANRERREWLHLQSADRRTDKVWFPCVARPPERGQSDNVTNNVTKRFEIHERTQTFPGTATVESWIFALHYGASRNCGDDSGVAPDSPSSMVSGSESARPRIEEQPGTFLVCCCKETSSLERDLTIEWENLPDKERSAGEGNIKVRPNVWTKLKEEREYGQDPRTTQDPRNKNTHTVSTGSANRRNN